jgi:hypothetical protein
MLILFRKKTDLRIAARPAYSTMAEREGFEPSRQVLAAYSISNRAPSAVLSHLSKKPIALSPIPWRIGINRGDLPGTLLATLVLYRKSIPAASAPAHKPDLFLSLGAGICILMEYGKL